MVGTGYGEEELWWQRTEVVGQWRLGQTEVVGHEARNTGLAGAFIASVAWMARMPRRRRVAVSCAHTLVLAAATAMAGPSSTGRESGSGFRWGWREEKREWVGPIRPTRK